jgi:VWFA-related protein
VAQRPTFSSQSQAVVLHVAVRDKRGYVDGLDESAFRVLEDKEPQTITYFSSQDTPVTLGLVIDSSGSMGANRARVIAAALAFARTSNPADEIFALGFNERVIAPLPGDAPFTSDQGRLRIALEQAIGARGQSAVYDGVEAGLKYLGKGHYDRKVLVLASDGADNASTIAKARVLADAEASNAVVYTVALIDPLEDKDTGFLRQLAEMTGGEAFEPSDVKQVGDALQKIAQDIRKVYTIGYVPSRLSTNNEMRRVTVEVMLPNGTKARVRTRREYRAGRAEELSDDR